MKNIAPHLPIACVILSAGKGTRMKSLLPKVLHPVAGLPMVGHVLHAANSLNPQEVIVVISPELPEVGHVVQSIDLDAQIAIQKIAQGTGDAVRAAESALKDFEGIVFVLFGDTPLILPETLYQMAQTSADVTVLGMRPADPAAYGRLICDVEGKLQRIVEFNDANEAERAVNLCNSGVMAVKANHLFNWLGRITNDNAKQEFYLTDIVGLAVGDGKQCVVVEAEEASLLGVNDRVQLAQAEAALQQRLREKFMRAGVTMIAPETVTLHHDSVIEQDVVIEPHVVIGQGVEIKSGATIRAFSHLEGAVIETGAVIGPYARLRPGSYIGEKAKVGNFVEIKNAEIQTGAKVSHLSYIGDAVIGEFANIGAGTITCNYDGYEKHRTSVGAYSFVGSNSALVAPVEIGEAAIIGAGSVITEDVDANSLSLTRSQQQHRANWARQFRNRKQN